MITISSISKAWIYDTSKGMIVPFDSEVSILDTPTYFSQVRSPLGGNDNQVTHIKWSGACSGNFPYAYDYRGRYYTIPTLGTVKSMGAYSGILVKEPEYTGSTSSFWWYKGNGRIIHLTLTGSADINHAVTGTEEEYWTSAKWADVILDPSSALTYPKTLLKVSNIDYPKVSVGEATHIYSNIVNIDAIIGQMRFTDLTAAKQLERFYEDEAEYAAFMDAASQFNISGNHIATIVELAATLKSLVSGFSGVGTLRDLWLQYRYVLNTTISDISEFEDERIRNTVTQKHYGTAVSNSGALFRCALSADPATGDLYRNGFSISLKTLWDMIPFSFVVDWLFPFGATAEAISDLQHYTNAYNYKSIVYSIKKEEVRYLQGIPFQVTYYHRYIKAGPPAETYLIESDPSLKTKVFRCIDSLCLFGKKGR